MAWTRLCWILQCPRRNYSSDMFSLPPVGLNKDCLGHDVSSDKLHSRTGIGPSQPIIFGPVPTITPQNFGFWSPFEEKNGVLTLQRMELIRSRFTCVGVATFDALQFTRRDYLLQVASCLPYPTTRRRSNGWHSSLNSWAWVISFFPPNYIKP